MTPTEKKIHTTPRLKEAAMALVSVLLVVMSKAAR